MRYAADLAAITGAATRIGPHLHRTPAIRCAQIDAVAGRRVLLKAENLQKTGSFKPRGALNAILGLPDSCPGVVTHSSGNFAQAAAWAAGLRSLPAHIVMPSDAPAVKQAAVRGYGGRIILCEPTQQAREDTAAAVGAETGATFLHPYDQAEVIAGQGTIALELLEDEPDLDAIVAPVGGGGLVSGIALAAAGLRPGLPVFAAEPQGADDAFRSRRDGIRHPQTAPRTIADGLRTGLGELTFPVVRDVVADVVRVSEEAIVAAMRLLYSRAKLVVEPSGAVALAAVLDPGFGRRELGTVAVVLSGGNVDLDALPWMPPKRRRP